MGITERIPFDKGRRLFLAGVASLFMQGCSGRRQGERRRSVPDSVEIARAKKILEGMENGEVETIIAPPGNAMLQLASPGKPLHLWMKGRNPTFVEVDSGVLPENFTGSRFFYDPRNGLYLDKIKIAERDLIKGGVATALVMAPNVLTFGFEIERDLLEKHGKEREFSFVPRATFWEGRVKGGISVVRVAHEEMIVGKGDEVGVLEIANLVRDPETQQLVMLRERFKLPQGAGWVMDREGKIVVIYRKDEELKLQKFGVLGKDEGEISVEVESDLVIDPDHIVVDDGRVAILYRKANEKGVLIIDQGKMIRFSIDTINSIIDGVQIEDVGLSYLPGSRGGITMTALTGEIIYYLKFDSSTKGIERVNEQ